LGRKLFITAKQLFEEHPERVKWIAEPWLASEAITELDGKAKSAGKTTFALAMCTAILTGSEFLGKPTSRGAIVYLTEESRPSFRSALERSGIGANSDFYILQWNCLFQLKTDQNSGSVWAQAVDAAIEEAKKVGARVLVVDTFAQFAHLVGDRENSAGDILEAMEPLQKARDAGLAVLLIRHERKEGGSVGESGRGSSALSGAVDIILRLHRPEGRHQENVRQLDALSRFDGTTPETTIALNDGHYEIVGTQDAVAYEVAMEKVRSVLPFQKENAMALEEVKKLTGSSRTTLQTALSMLEAQAFIARCGAGKRGDCQRYFQVAAGTPGP
jgi:AAA domain